MMTGVTLAPTWRPNPLVLSEREALEEKLRIIAGCPRNLLEMNIDRFFATILQVAEYNLRHPDDPIRRMT